jgi:hypothetical protein
MLLDIKYDVINSLLIKLRFDDNSVKEARVSIGDVVNCSYNKNGMRKTIEGVVKRIATENNPCNCPKWYMYVDSSKTGFAAVEKIEVDKILDIDVLRKGAGLMVIHTPGNRMMVSDFRINGNYLQCSPDYGKHWFKVAELRCDTYDVPAEYQELAARIDSLLPRHMNPGVRSDLIVALVNLFKDLNPEDVTTQTIEDTLHTDLNDVTQEDVDNLSNGD